jgi:hypothetical protein
MNGCIMQFGMGPRTCLGKNVSVRFLSHSFFGTSLLVDSTFRDM